MGEPQHLSIGEVLSLVQRDFPDVTISKIRFLESQGLLDPERTPSGYRKFYATDIERLQWILTQQRDNFLPLRVIRERLDEWDATGVSPAGSGSDESFPQPEPVHDGSGRVEGDQVEPSTDGQDAGGDDSGAVGSASPAEGPETLDLRSAAEALAAASADEVAAIRAEREARERAAQERAHDAAGSVGNGADLDPAGVVAGADSGEEPRTEVVGDAEEEFRVGPLDTAMTAEELAERAGVTVAVVKELESFSMISSHRVGPEHYYEPECLRVAGAVAPFLERGIEVRHLRMYKIAAEREAGVFEQLVMPLLKQRNPDARARAVAQVQALSEAGERLHAALLRQALEQTLP